MGFIDMILTIFDYFRTKIEHFRLADSLLFSPWVLVLVFLAISTKVLVDYDTTFGDNIALIIIFRLALFD